MTTILQLLEILISRVRNDKNEIVEYSISYSSDELS